MKRVVFYCDKCGSEGSVVRVCIHGCDSYETTYWKHDLCRNCRATLDKIAVIAGCVNGPQSANDEQSQQIRKEFGELKYWWNMD